MEWSRNCGAFEWSLNKMTGRDLEQNWLWWSKPQTYWSKPRRTWGAKLKPLTKKLLNDRPRSRNPDWWSKRNREPNREWMKKPRTLTTHSLYTVEVVKRVVRPWGVVTWVFWVSDGEVPVFCFEFSAGKFMFLELTLVHCCCWDIFRSLSYGR